VSAMSGLLPAKNAALGRVHLKLQENHVFAENRQQSGDPSPAMGDSPTPSIWR
jgi:hypothetical protein